MVNKFSPKKICERGTLGEHLVYWRNKKNFSLKEVAAALSLSPRYLAALEASDYAHLPGKVYLKNFLKKICSFYALSTTDKREIFSCLDREYALFSELQQQKKKKKFFLTITPQHIRTFLLVSLFFLFFAYLAGEAKSIFQPPLLQVAYPPDNLIVHSYLLKIKGNTLPGAEVRINGKKVLLTNKGGFKEDVTLHPGVNIIKIKAQKKYSYPRVIYKKVLVVNN